MCRVMAKRKGSIEGEDSDSDVAAEVVQRPKKSPAYKYSVEEDTAILRAFAR